MSRLVDDEYHARNRERADHDAPQHESHDFSSRVMDVRAAPAASVYAASHRRIFARVVTDVRARVTAPINVASHDYRCYHDVLH
jgi:hypothetical protein